MKKYNKATPPGTRDRLFEECAAREEIRRRLTDLFRRRGYSEIVTPTLEYYDVFSGESGFPQEEMYTLTDSSGRLLVLRPDMTLPIARVAATRLKDAPPPLRLCYTAPVYRAGAGFTGRSSEIMQSGMELLGAFGIRADLEILTAGIQALDECGAPDFRVEIGHNGFFSGLLAQLSLSEEQREELHAFIERKNYVALENILQALPDSPALTLLRALPRLSGGMAALEEAKALCGPQCMEAVAYLERIYKSLSALGYGEKLSIDLGLVHANQYYTGVIFRGYIEGSGVTVLSGGRYDGLLREFGTPMPATGFALETDALAQAMVARGHAPAPPKPQVLVFGLDGYEIEAQLYLSRLLKQGIRCELSLDHSAEEAKKRAKAQGFARLDLVGETTRSVIFEGGTAE